MNNILLISFLFSLTSLSNGQTSDSTVIEDCYSPSPSFLWPEEFDKELSLEDKLPPNSLQIYSYKGSKFFIYKIKRTSKNIHLDGYDQFGKPRFYTLKNFISTVMRENVVDLEFAMNGGMYDGSNRPVGLFVSNEKIIQKLDTQTLNPNEVNFYLQPNGVFYSYFDNDGKLIWDVSTTKSFINQSQVKCLKIKDATQSGPMLISDCMINKAFGVKSHNKKIRNAVGVSKDNVYFVMSYAEINFFDMANFMLSLKVEDALYLDGVVSQFYYHPKKRFFGSSVPIGPIISIYEK